MKKYVFQGLTAIFALTSAFAYGQRDRYENDRYDRYDSRYRTSDRYDDRRDDRRRDEDRRDDRDRDDRRDDDRRYQMDRSDYRRLERRYDDMRDDVRDDVRRSNRYGYDERDMRRFERQSNGFDYDRRATRPGVGSPDLYSLQVRELRKAYEEGYEDGREDVEKEMRKQKREDYKNFTFGVYAGANSTRFAGEDIDGNNLSGRLGYQLGFFVRGGGRLYGQLGAEYLTSSSNFYQPGDGASVSDITSNVDQQWLHIPAYVGIKLAQSDRGISAVRFQVGAEYATPLRTNSNQFGFEDADFRSSSINGLVNLGFDAGPFMLGFVYHHGFDNIIRETTNTRRRILGVNVGLKF